MLILHTSDWHLGKRLNECSRIEEQEAVMNEMVTIARTFDVNAILIAGDVFDTVNPPVEAIELLYRTLTRLSEGGKRLVLVVAGNHDSPDRIESPDPLARANGIVFLGYPSSKVNAFELESGLKTLHCEPGFTEFALPHCAHPLRIVHTPYANELRLKQYLGCANSEESFRQVLQQNWQQQAETWCNTTGVNILTTHLYVMDPLKPAPEEPEEERSIQVGGAQAVYPDNFPSCIQYAALGHLHRKQVISHNPCPIVYAGSPLSYSFSETNQQKYVLLINAEPNQPATMKPVELTSGKRLLRKRAESIDHAIEWLQNNPQTWVELTVATDTYLSAADRKRLNEAHTGIVTLIPEITNEQLLTSNRSTIHELGNDMHALFSAYFKSRNKGQEPDKVMLQLFDEVLASDTKNE